MGTRSSICVEREDGTYIGVYCHWDGYLEWNGHILATFYCTAESALELIEGGDISTLDRDTGDAKYYALRGNWERIRGKYAPDSGEPWDNVKPLEAASYREFLDKAEQEYNYLFRGGIWEVFSGHTSMEEVAEEVQ